MRVTQQLDPELDFATFELGEIGFGNVRVAVPPGRIYYRTRLDLRQSVGLFVDVEARFDPSTGQAVWTLTGLDPRTLDLPEDPFAGFLPPNNRSPEGEGFVSYSVRPRVGLVTRDKIEAFATIVFDDNDPIRTPNHFNTIDAAPPTSTVQPLPATSRSRFTVRWSGADDAGGSGIATYDVFVSVDDGPFQPWLVGTTLTSARFLGEFGRSYRFYSLATDNVGHQQRVPGDIASTYVGYRLDRQPLPLQPGTGPGGAPGGAPGRHSPANEPPPAPVVVRPAAPHAEPVSAVPLSLLTGPEVLPQPAEPCSWPQRAVEHLPAFHPSASDVEDVVQALVLDRTDRRARSEHAWDKGLPQGLTWMAHRPIP